MLQGLSSGDRDETVYRGSAVSDKPLKNIPASVRQRLLNRAKADNRPFNELLQYYAMERFLYRLSTSPGTPRSSS